MHRTKISLPLELIIELRNDELSRWRVKLAGWKAVRKGTGEPCWLCDEIGPYTTYQHPDSSRSHDWAYDICPACEKALDLWTF